MSIQKPQFLKKTVDNDLTIPLDTSAFSQNQQNSLTGKNMLSLKNLVQTSKVTGDISAFADMEMLLEAKLVMVMKGWGDTVHLSLHDTGDTPESHYARLWFKGEMAPVRIALKHIVPNDWRQAGIMAHFVCKYQGKPWVVFQDLTPGVTRVSILHGTRELIEKPNNIILDYAEATSNDAIQILNGTPILRVRRNDEDMILYGDRILEPVHHTDYYEKGSELRLLLSTQALFFAHQIDGQLVYAYRALLPPNRHKEIKTQRVLVVGERTFPGLHKWKIDRHKNIIALMDVDGRKSHVEITEDGPVRIDAFLGDREIVDMKSLPYSTTTVYLVRDANGDILVQTKDGEVSVGPLRSDNMMMLHFDTFRERKIAVIRCAIGSEPTLARVYVP